MKMTILWTSPAAYTLRFLRELHDNYGFRMQIFYRATEADAPYNSLDMSFFEQSHEDSPEDRPTLEQKIDAFDPDCILMASWPFKHFMRACRRMRRRGTYVVSAMDNQWHGTVKQYLGILTSKIFLKPSIDTMFVAGDRQRYFAQRLGYNDPIYGYCCADTDLFRSTKVMPSRGRNFLYVGRLVPEKGIDLLAAAYRDYRARTANPWKLKIAGAGRLTHLFDGIDGVELLGFQQPSALPTLMETCRCFVLPSLFEPWGVVLHEAAAAALPLIATSPCGGTTMFVRDGINGYVVPPTSQRLTSAMLAVSEWNDERLTEASKLSSQLAELWTPHLQARYFSECMITRAIRHK